MIDEKLLKQKHYGTLFLFFFLFFFLCFLLFVFFVPIKTYHTYPSIITNSYVKIYIPKENLLRFSKSTLYVNGEKKSFQIKEFLVLEDGSLELLLDIPEIEKEENKILEITSLERKQTLFRRWWSFLKKKVVN